MHQDRPCYFHPSVDDDQVAPGVASQLDRCQRSESEADDLQINILIFYKKEVGRGEYG